MASEKIGRHIIKSELGRGGMATVYHAYDHLPMPPITNPREASWPVLREAQGG